jgi:hypothetical protein
MNINPILTEEVFKQGIKESSVSFLNRTSAFSIFNIKQHTSVTK